MHVRINVRINVSACIWGIQTVGLCQSPAHNPARQSKLRTPSGESMRLWTVAEVPWIASWWRRTTEWVMQTRAAHEYQQRCLKPAWVQPNNAAHEHQQRCLRPGVHGCSTTALVFSWNWGSLQTEAIMIVACGHAQRACTLCMPKQMFTTSTDAHLSKKSNGQVATYIYI